MLVLTRKAGEEIVVRHAGGLLKIKLVSVKKGDSKGEARIGIEASQDFHIIRKELELHGNEDESLVG